MRTRAAVGVLVATVLVAAQASPAHAADQLTYITLAATGSLKVVWHGDPARGCQEAGMCGYSGSIRYSLARRAFLDIDRFEGVDEVFGFIDARGPTRVRVRRQVTGGPAAECRERFGQAVGFTLDVEHAYRDRHRLGIGTNVIPSPRASGRCAGPRLADFVGSMPTATFRLRDLKRRGTRVSLAGRFPFSAGALTGEVVSTLALRTRRVTRRKPIAGGPGNEPRPKRMALVDIDYDVVRALGDAHASFRGIESPLCTMLDACGTTGSESYALGASTGSFHVFGAAPLRGRHKPTVRRALEMALRHGYLFGFGRFERGSSRTTSTLAHPGSRECLDQLSPARPSLTMVRQRGRRLRVILGPQYLDAARDKGSDLLHGRCPGPTLGDVLHGSTLADARLSLGTLMSHELKLTFTRSGRFSAGPYRGTASAGFKVRMKRVRAHVAVGVGGSVEVITGGTSASAQRP
jgi:hypothetical protein